MDAQEPVVSIAIEPASRADREKLFTGLQELAAQDPTFRVQVDQHTGNAIVAGMGELHLEIIIDRLKREFNLEARVGEPQVLYKETGHVLLEPIMRIEVVGPRGHMADVTSDLANRRGHVQSQEDRGSAQIISASVPLSEMFGYAADLRSRTLGRATYSMRLDRYQQVTGPPLDPCAPVREPRSHGPEGRNSAASVPEPESD